MQALQAFVQRHPLPIYYILTFAISWGGIMMVVGPGGILGSEEIPEDLMPLVYVATLAGPSVAGILLTALVYGRAGLRDLLSRLLRWRVGVRWYAVALLTAPLSMLAVLFALSLVSPEFLPGIVSAGDKGALLLTGLAAGLMVGIFEELGWTGFAVPRLRLRYGVLATGLIVGLLWGLWHFPLFSGSGSSLEPLPRALLLFVQLFSFLPAFRVLMVWVYDRTESLLVAALMHAGLTAGVLILPPMTLTGTPLIIYDLVLAAALWGIVAVVYAGRKREYRSGRAF